MDPASLNNNTTGTRKVRFAPKAPPRRESKPAVVKNEVIGDAAAADDADAVQARELLRQFNESSLARKPKVEKKLDPSRIAFGYGGASTSMKSYGASKGGSSSNRYQGPAPVGGGANAPGLRAVKEYREPWDYYSYYPVTLPMRRPYSGDPELLDEEEFAEASESMGYDEDSTKPAIELGLMEESQETNMLFLQLPEIMPIIKPSVSTDGKKEIASSLKPPSGAGHLEKTCSLNELPAGFMGKMLVYRSGAIKLKLGDTLYDVSPGLDCVFAQDVVAINTKEKHCCIVGELNKHATIAPDVDSILDSMADL
ncbi:hypothetical protein L1049_022259 [Liquidambar formosana]|uniref:DNA-directed RNA polymerase III subunit RPC4 n=1 Tax=Liquidambar formosana TaxID=63359 RepID=A0AAP0WNM8_LIQFO